MIIKREEGRSESLRHCHGGEGSLLCSELYADYERAAPGVRFIHEDEIPPGASIGEHSHEGEEEVYYILAGRGSMTVNDTQAVVAPGDAVLIRSGDRHSLANDGPETLRLLVVGIQLIEVTN